MRRYRIIYLKHVDGTDEHYLTVPVKTKKIPGRETSTILTDLEPNSVYVVKIQAMLSVRRGKRVKGRWDVMYLKTPPIAKVTTQQEKCKSQSFKEYYCRIYYLRKISIMHKYTRI